MGGWALEVSKMVLYISFPVGMFHYFNQPAYFEKWVTEKKREIYPPEDPKSENEIKNTIKFMRQKRDEEMMKALDKFENNKQNS